MKLQDQQYRVSLEILDQNRTFYGKPPSVIKLIRFKAANLSEKRAGLRMVFSTFSERSSSNLQNKGFSRLIESSITEIRGVF